MITDILPQELVLHIFKFLDYEAIYFMNMVSTYFNYLIPIMTLLSREAVQ